MHSQHAAGGGHREKKKKKWEGGKEGRRERGSQRFSVFVVAQIKRKKGYEMCRGGVCGCDFFLVEGGGGLEGNE